MRFKYYSKTIQIYEFISIPIKKLKYLHTIMKLYKLLLIDLHLASMKCNKQIRRILQSLLIF